MTRVVPFAVVLGLFFSQPVATGAPIQVRLGQVAPDFPPGPFSDGGQYQLSDLKGKVVVLFFFESTCPTCRTSIPERNALMKAMQGKPVVFLAVGANITLAEAQAYQRGTGLAMPIYPDSLGLMQYRYDFQISLQNIWQFRVIGPDGTIQEVNMTADAINKVLDQGKTEQKYNPADFDAKLRPIVNLLESSQYGLGVRALAPLRQNLSKTLAESARKLYAEAKAEGEKWKAEADTALESDPLMAYDLYSKLAASFPMDELGKSASAAAKKLATAPAVAAELAARKAFAQLNLGLVKVLNRTPVIQMCGNTEAKKHPNTPTADKATALAEELGRMAKK